MRTYAAGSGAFAGFCSGLLGVGGFLLVLACTVKRPSHDFRGCHLSWRDVISHLSSATVVSTIAGIGLDRRIATPFGVGALAGVNSGRGLAISVAARQQQQYFAAPALTVSPSMLMEACQ